MEGSIFITGGAGFLGRAIIQRAQDFNWPCRFTVYSRDETKQDELKRRFPESAITCILGDVLDAPHLEGAVAGHDVVIHAAAVKYIPEAERNSWETVRVNVDGSRNVAQAAGRAGVPLCLGVSTDKAVDPANQYGRTKAVMEHLYQEAPRRWPGTKFGTVRYGNVVGSTGSVATIFARQLAERGRVTLTDPTMTRFWMAPWEAVDLINHALGALEEGDVPNGSCLIHPCRAMTIENLAWAVASHHGIVTFARHIIGPRPGEKHDELLVGAGEQSRVQMWPETTGWVLLPIDTPVLPGYEPASMPDGYSSATAERLTPSEMILALQEAAAL